MSEFTENDIQCANSLTGYLSFIPNFILEALSDCIADIIFIVTGNQMGKTSSVAYDYIRRILGLHPIEKKNMRPNIPVRIIRLASVKLPTESDPTSEISNPIYPQLKKWLPYEWIKKDITARRPAITIRDPQGGKDITFEFVSYNMETESQAGFQRWSVYLDEQPPKGFYEEQIPRLYAAGGDLIIGATPVESITWMYEDIYQKAGVIYNSPTIIEYMRKKGTPVRRRETILGGSKKIAVIRAATDDNPTLDPVDIEDKNTGLDEDIIEIRRYGIFHQITGVIFKEFDNCHVISEEEFFSDGVPHDWIHSRGIDFHEFTNWAIPWLALSPDNEAFVYNEYNPSPQRNVTLTIARQIAEMSGDYKYAVNLIDPWAAKKQSNSGYTVVDDLNRYFQEFRKEGLGTGGYWQTWDTKNLRGRDIVKERLKNARVVARPFNNRVVRNGEISYLPTLWFFDKCHETIHSFKNWRKDEWVNRESLITKDEKDKAQQKYSHFPIAIECLFKHPALNCFNFRSPILQQRQSPYANYMRA